MIENWNTYVVKSSFILSGKSLLLFKKKPTIFLAKSLAIPSSNLLKNISIKKKLLLLFYQVSYLMSFSSISPDENSGYG